MGIIGNGLISNNATFTVGPRYITPPVPTIASGYTMYLDPLSYSGSTGNIGAAAVTWPDISGNAYNASVTPGASGYVTYQKTGSLAFFQFTGSTTLFNGSTAVGSILMNTFPQAPTAANTVGYNSSGIATNTVTLSSWFYTPNQYSSNGQTISVLSKPDTVTIRTQYIYGDYQLSVGHNATILSVLTPDGTLLWTTGSWNNIVTVISGSLNVGVNSVKLYANGALYQTYTPLTQTQNIGFTSTTSTLSIIDSNNNAAQQYPVSYGQHLLYNNRALTDAEVLQNYNAVKAIYGL